MTEPADRVTVLEHRVDAIEQRAELESALRLSMQHDLATIKQRQIADGALLQALHLTQNLHTNSLAEHSRVLAEHSRVLDEHSRVLDEHTDTLAEHGLKLNNLQGGVDRIIGMLDTLLEREAG
ncbi:hypothetical protein [Cryptosporangium sp. NPDC051539]|uniref:hypothetical protein n=1 Tax=Cryptosporangium sp. NPDC051539 TaxID=3363962 RepID=UPI0037A1269A